MQRLRKGLSAKSDPSVPPCPREVNELNGRNDLSEDFVGKGLIEESARSEASVECVVKEVSVASEGNARSVANGLNEASEESGAPLRSAVNEQSEGNAGSEAPWVRSLPDTTARTAAPEGSLKKRKKLKSEGSEQKLGSKLEAMSRRLAWKCPFPVLKSARGTLTTITFQISIHKPSTLCLM